jgi:hypothetical protein
VAPDARKGLPAAADQQQIHAYHHRLIAVEHKFNRQQNQLARHAGAEKNLKSTVAFPHASSSVRLALGNLSISRHGRSSVEVIQ